MQLQDSRITGLIVTGFNVKLIIFVISKNSTVGSHRENLLSFGSAVKASLADVWKGRWEATTVRRQSTRPSPSAMGWRIRYCSIPVILMSIFAICSFMS